MLLQGPTLESCGRLGRRRVVSSGALCVLADFVVCARKLVVVYTYAEARGRINSGLACKFWALNLCEWPASRRRGSQQPSRRWVR